MKLSRNRRLAIVVALTVAADWASKVAVRREIPFEAERDVVEGWLSFQHHFNKGIAFSWFADMPSSWRMPLLVLLTLGGMLATVSIMRQSRDRWIHVAGALVLGGALGNLGDRLVDGGVTDFIFVHFFPYIFNVADIAISIGGALLVLRMIFDTARRDEAAPTHA
ncbi:signal peptidase II [Longimicrobium sp.]|uniref:signal peptidase II n=1 Tax=Longimicrobium sp. TaxID=2029185 RepID=UPI002E3751C5|nr:signal peptidase II [Longimicrobium sp.]HEX6037722.1 signal peptidase II [Longimicrobium sp.]